MKTVVNKTEKWYNTQHTELQEHWEGACRSSCLRMDMLLAIRKIMEKYGLPQMLRKYLGAKDRGLFPDLSAYSIICENHAGLYYPIYALQAIEKSSGSFDEIMAFLKAED